jgi:hypothetical protein
MSGDFDHSQLVLLPRIDPDALLTEDDPKVLDAYARGLWQQWQALDSDSSTSRKPGRKAETKYTKVMVRAATVWLVDAYACEATPIPYELTRLIRAMLIPKGSNEATASTSPVQRDSEKAYWKAILFAAQQTRQPTAYAIAQYLLSEGLLPVREGRENLPNDAEGRRKSAEATVRGWLRLAHFKENVRLYSREKARLPLERAPME